MSEAAKIERDSRQSQSRGKLIISGNRLKSLCVLCISAAAAAGALSACGSSNSSSSVSGDGSSASGSLQGKKVFLISCVNAVPYCAQENKVIEEGLGEEGISVTTLTDEYSGPEEAAHINQAISQQAAGIIWVANKQEAARSALQKAKANGIPVIMNGTPPEPIAEGLYTSYVGVDQQEAGKQQAEMIVAGAEKSGLKSGKIIYVTGTQGTPTVVNTIEGWNEALEATPQYEVVAEPDGEWDPIKASQVVQPVFAKYGQEIVGAGGMSGAMAAATAKSAEQAGLKVGEAKGGMVVVGLNCDSESIKAVKDGAMYGTSSMSPFVEGEYSVKGMIKALMGEKVSARIVVPNKPIYKSNVAEFESSCVY